MSHRHLASILAFLLLIGTTLAAGQSGTTAETRIAPGAVPAAERPFGTLRDQAAMQQAWLKQRLDTFLPPLMSIGAVVFATSARFIYSP